MVIKLAEIMHIHILKQMEVGHQLQCIEVYGGQMVIHGQADLDMHMEVMDMLKLQLNMQVLCQLQFIQHIHVILILLVSHFNN